MSQLIHGKQKAEALRQSFLPKIQYFEKRYNQKVCLAVILVGQDPASQVYVKNKQKACEALGILSQTYTFSEETDLETLLQCIDSLNQNPQVHGILCQLPLPKHLNTETILTAIRPEKDVDGFHPLNRGYLASGQREKALIPCTPQGIVYLLEDYYNSQHENLKGKNICVLGRSNIVGRPVAQLLEQKDATVTLCHSKTLNLKACTQQADIVVVAIGKPEFLTAEYLKVGAVVIDVGIHRQSSGLCGDVDFESCQQKVSALTPVPGGVGPMTITYLLYNTIKAAYLQKGETF